MATKYWEPKAIAVAQVTTVTVGGTLAGETFTISVNGIAIASHTDTDTVIATTVADLVSDWNASTHPYATGITAADASPDITLTADTAEVPFTITLNTPGGSATFTQAATTAPTGPHTLDEADNWDSETLPSNSDVLVFRGLSTNIVWGLDGLSTTGHTVNVEQSFTGLIGLEPTLFATSADGATTVSTAQEYRAQYMTLDASVINIGRHDGPGDPGGSRRIMIDNDRAGSSQTNITRTSPTGQVNGRPAVLLKYAHASADLDIRSGSVGIGVGVPGEAVTVGDVLVGSADVSIGDNVTLTNYEQEGGSGKVNVEVATLTAATLHGGTLWIHGDQAITTLEVRGGTVYPMSTGTITTVNQYGGTVDYTESRAARTVTTHKLFPGGGARVLFDPGILTLTNNISTDSTPMELAAA